MAVFHSLFLSACERRRSVRSAHIGHYVLPPASVQDGEREWVASRTESAPPTVVISPLSFEEVRKVVGRLIWESGEEQPETEASAVP